MAIDQATGALKNYLLKISTSVHYNRFKQRLWGLMSHTPRLLRLCQKAGNAVKQGLLNKSNFFESLNFRYFGPVDGHNLKELVRTLRALRDIEGPKLLHVMTVKGKGYLPAEHDQPAWHAPGRFNPDTGERISAPGGAARYQDVFGETLLELARRDERVVGVTPAMPSGCSMNILLREMPGRCFDVGIAEGHAVTFSAGLAAAGMVPFCNIYSSFMQRAYDNVIHDVAIQDLPVVMCLDRGGIVGEDGVGQQYSDKTQSYAVRKYIDPSLIGIDFSAAVVETLNSAGSITVNFTVTNTGSLTMEDMVLRESEYGEIYRLDTFAPGTQTINQKVNVSTPRDLTFTLEIADPSGNLYTYTAYITADYVGTAASTDETPAIETPADLVAEVGSSVSSALRTVLIVLAVLTVVAGVALVILSALEKKERERIARRRAARERKLREQALEAAGMLPRSRSSLPPDNGTTRIPPTRK